MSIAYRCDERLRCTFIVWDGDVTPEQWDLHAERIMNDPGFPPGPLLLADLGTAGDIPSITGNVIGEMAQRWRAHAADLTTMQCALVPNAAWDKARKFGAGLEGSGLRVMMFNEPWSASSWLGLDSNVVRPVLDELRGELRRAAS